MYQCICPQVHLSEFIVCCRVQNNALGYFKCHIPIRRAGMIMADKSIGRSQCSVETITKWRAFEWHIIKWVTFIEMPGRLTRVTNQAKNVVWKMAAHCRQCAGVHKQLPGDGAEYHRVLGPTTRTLPACIWSGEYKLWLNIEILLRSLCVPVRKITNYFRLHALSKVDKLLMATSNNVYSPACQNVSFACC